MQVKLNCDIMLISKTNEFQVIWVTSYKDIFNIIPTPDFSVYAIFQLGAMTT